MRRIYAIVLVLCMTVTLMPMSANASVVIGEGECGTADGSMIWAVTDDGTLTISGTGEMRDYEPGYRYAPWSAHLVNVTKVVINEGVTRIGAYAFLDMRKITSFDLPESLVSIGIGAFERCFGVKEISLPPNLTELQTSRKK